jgi:hypothetical protein
VNDRAIIGNLRLKRAGGARRIFVSCFTRNWNVGPIGLA